MKEFDWRRLATDRNVPPEVARRLWERAQATAPADPLKAQQAFRQLLDRAASNGATRTPGKETLVDSKGPSDAASLGPGKTTRVLEEQKLAGPAKPDKRPPARAQAPIPTVTPSAKPPAASQPVPSQFAAPKAPPSHDAPAPTASTHAPVAIAATPAQPAAAGGLAPAVAQAHERERQRVATAFDSAEARIQQSAMVEQVQLQAAGVAKANELVATIDARAVAGRGAFEVARQKLTTAAHAQGALARSDARAAATGIRDEYERQQVDAVTKATSEGDRMIVAAHQAGASVTRSYMQTKTVIVALMQAGFAVAQQELGKHDAGVARTALHTAAESIGQHLQDQALADADALLHQAKQNQQALIKEAWDQFSEERGKKVSELADAITANGEKLAQKFEQKAMQDLGDLGAAEQAYLTKLNRLKASSAALLEESTHAMRRVQTTAVTYAGSLRSQRDAALSHVDAFARQASDQMHAHPRDNATAAGHVSQELTKLATSLIADAAEGQPNFEGVATRFRAEVDVRVTKSIGALGRDAATISSRADDHVAAMTTQCAASRSLAQVTYSGMLLQLSAQSVQQQQTATNHWRVETDKFTSYAQGTAAAALAQHHQLVAQLPGQLRGAALRALVADHETKAESAFDALLGLAVNIVVGGLEVLVLVALTPLEVTGAAVVLAVYAIARAFHARVSTLSSQWDSLSTREKIDGVFVSFLASIPDTVGVSDLGAAIFNTDTFTGLPLPKFERQRKLFSGALGALTSIFAIKGVGDGIKGIGKPPLPDVDPLPGSGEKSPLGGSTNEPVTTKPAETKPAETKPAETKPAETKTTESKPAESKPGESKPGEPSAAATKPAETKPAETKPAETKPAETKPAETKPAETKPADTRPVEAKSEKTNHEDNGSTDAKSGSSESTSSKNPSDDASANKRARLLAKGIQSQRVEELGSQFGEAGLEAVDRLVSDGVQPTSAVKVLEEAGRAGVTEELVGLVNSGKLRHPTTLRAFLHDLVIEVARGQHGKLNELREARVRAESGQEVSLGGSTIDPAKPQSGEADVVQYGSRPEAIQMKTVSSADVRKVSENLDYAVNQLKGKTGERPPVGAKKIARAVIEGKNNPLFRASRAEIIKELRLRMESLVSGDVVEIQIRNEIGEFVIPSSEIVP